LFDSDNEKIFINDLQYFGKVSSEIWTHQIGGYQVLDKWLKARKEAELTFEEIETFLKAIESIKHTKKIVNKIDTIYDSVEEKIISNKEFEKFERDQNSLMRFT